MKKLFALLSCVFIFSAVLIAAPVSSVEDDLKFEETKVTTELIVPENQHCTDKHANVRIEYMPMYDEIRIYYETLYVSYDRGEAMNSVIACVEDFMKDKKYNRYRYLKPESQKYWKDDRGQRKAQWSAYIKLER
ncbi:MAG: hypothetical protein K5681_07155 [Treponema sp.]|nr:hypothetical protein [Treponema sp.]